MSYDPWKLLDEIDEKCQLRLSKEKLTDMPWETVLGSKDRGLTRQVQPARRSWWSWRSFAIFVVLEVAAMVGLLSWRASHDAQIQQAAEVRITAHVDQRRTATMVKADTLERNEKLLRNYISLSMAPSLTSDESATIDEQIAGLQRTISDAIYSGCICMTGDIDELGRVIAQIHCVCAEER